MAQLGAEGVLDTPHIPELSSRQPEQAPPAEEAIGGRVTIHFAGVGGCCRGELLAYSAVKQVCGPNSISTSGKRSSMTA